LLAQLPREQSVRILKNCFLVAIVLQTIVGLILPQFIDPGLEGGSRWLLTGVLAVVSLVSLFTLRWLVLPNTTAKSSGGAKAATNAAIVGYAYADAIAIYGLVASVLTGETLVSIPFGVLALIGWLLVGDYFSTSRQDRIV
jgi:hypothetical protein